MKKDYCNEPFKCMVAIGDSITAGIQQQNGILMGIRALQLNIAIS